VFLVLLPVRGRWAPGSACFSGNGRDGVAVTCAQGPRRRVESEGDPAFPQVPNDILTAGRGEDVQPAAGTPPTAPGAGFGAGFGAGQEQVQGRQVRQDAVLADVGVLRPGGVGGDGAGVAVAAAVGGFAVGPG